MTEVESHRLTKDNRKEEAVLLTKLYTLATPLRERSL